MPDGKAGSPREGRRLNIFINWILAFYLGFRMSKPKYILTINTKIHG